MTNDTLTRVHVGYTIHRAYREALRDHSLQTGIPQGRLIEDALAAMLRVTVPPGTHGVRGRPPKVVEGQA